jgi:hypothetical protein
VPAVVGLDVAVDDIGPGMGIVDDVELRVTKRVEPSTLR